MSGFQPYLEPRAIAIIGASSNPDKPGYTLMSSIVEGGYKGAVYPINPKPGSILGKPTYPSISDVPGEVDLAFILIGREHVPEAIRACGRKGVKSAAIVTAGFGEVESGHEYDRDLRAAIGESGVRCVGPNTIGMVNMHHGLSASFVPLPVWSPGKISLLGQTGTIAGSLADQIMHQPSQRLDVGKIVAIGNKADLDEVDFLEYCWNDSQTEVIGLHLESLSRPREFFSLAQKVKADKPTVILKSGRTEAGGRVSASHTGGLMVDDAVFDAACRQYGLIRATSVPDFLAFLKALSFQPPPRGERIGVVSYSGGMAVTACDELSEAGLRLGDFGTETKRLLADMLPDWQPVKNPVDLWPAMTGDNLGVQGRSIRIGMDDTETDAVLLILLAVPNSACEGLSRYFREAMAANPHKPIYCVFVGGAVAEQWKLELEREEADKARRVPVFDDTSTAARALGAAAWYYRRRDRFSADPNLQAA
jgi:acyl-CoA synthetase (NDP forming)